MEKQEALLSQRPTQDIVSRQSGKCSRCGRKLTDPVSIQRGMGPVCWTACKGDVFERDLEADEKEWQRRERELRQGAEWDFGCNWTYAPSPDRLPVSIRISIRYSREKETFEVYGHVPGEGEIIFGASADVKTAWQIAVNAGPRCEAEAYRTIRAARRRSRRVA